MYVYVRMYVCMYAVDLSAHLVLTPSKGNTITLHIDIIYNGTTTYYNIDVG